MISVLNMQLTQVKFPDLFEVWFLKICILLDSLLNNHEVNSRHVC